MQNIHPIFVHFPIALIVVSFLLETAGLYLKKEELRSAAKWNLWIGVFFATFTVGTGLWAEETVKHPEEAHEIMELHETFGWLILVSASLLSLWKLKAKPEWEEKYKFFVLSYYTVMISILIFGAHLGGRLVYEFGTGVNVIQEQSASSEKAEISEEKKIEKSEEPQKTSHRHLHQHKH